MTVVLQNLLAINVCLDYEILDMQENMVKKLHQI